MTALLTINPDAMFGFGVIAFFVAMFAACVVAALAEIFSE